MKPDLVVLLVEDHQMLAETLTDYLECENIEVDYAADGLQALSLVKENRYDAIILDVMLPSIDGFTVCKTIRAELQLDTPILMLTARDTLDDKIEGFEHGADDYLVKPFEQRELVARLRTMVKRYRAEVVTKDTVVGPLTLQHASRTAHREGKSFELPPLGYAILKLLMRESPAIVTREALHLELWGSEPPDTDSLRSHIYNLRKLIDHPFEQPMIETVKGVGLRLREQETGTQ